MLRSLCLFVVFVLSGLFAGCNGGSQTSSLGSAPACLDSGEFCLVSCNLGCQLNGSCAVSEIAQNQPIRLVFSEPIDASSATAGAVSLKTANGETPAGTTFIDGNTLVFQPEVRLVGGVTTFGFRADETYVLNLPTGAEGSTLRSISGDLLSTPVVCALTVSQGLVDLDGQPPVPQLISPSVSTNVPLDATIVVRFSELIDLGPFQNASTQTSPIIYRLRKTRPDRNDPSRVVCDPEFEPILIQGVPVSTVNATEPQTTDISLKPAIDLPANVCVEVVVTNQVRDLAGNTAEVTTFRFFTDPGTGGPTTLTETFSGEQQMDRAISGGSWEGGRGIPASLGGRGIHGSFQADSGVPVLGQTETYVFNTDNTVIAKENTLFGEPLPPITDGVYEFTDLFVPQGVTVIFRGSKPAVLKVRGQVNVEGKLTVNGGSVASNYDATSKLINLKWTAADGQPGAEGGAGGGGGGKGGKGCDGQGASADFRGSPGEDVVIPASSGYAGSGASSGGGGGPVYPASGLNANVEFNLFGAVCGQVAGGGGGGSFLGMGADGEALRTFTNNGDLGPGGSGGTELAFVPQPNGTSVADHFFVGGAGGGGGGSQPTNMIPRHVNSDGRTWHAGGGGLGGGGVMNIRAGGGVVVGGVGSIEARGGDGVLYKDAPFGPPSPGGGGSGGTIILQVPDVGLMRQGGSLDVSGGEGSRLRNNAFNGVPVESIGGMGGYGYVRLEAQGNVNRAALGNVIGPSNVTASNYGQLTEEDDASGFASRWRSSRQIFPPTFLYYEIKVRTGGPNGPLTIYTDNPDPAKFNPADRAGLPIEVYVQGAEVNPATNLPESEPGPWRKYCSQDAGASINDDLATGFRFMVLFDRTIEKDIWIENFSVTFD